MDRINEIRQNKSVEQLLAYFMMVVVYKDLNFILSNPKWSYSKKSGLSEKNHSFFIKICYVMLYILYLKSIIKIVYKKLTNIDENIPCIKTYLKLNF